MRQCSLTAVARDSRARRSADRSCPERLGRRGAGAARASCGDDRGPGRVDEAEQRGRRRRRSAPCRCRHSSSSAPRDRRRLPSGQRARPVGRACNGGDVRLEHLQIVQPAERLLRALQRAAAARAAAGTPRFGGDLQAVAQLLGGDADLRAGVRGCTSGRRSAIAVASALARLVSRAASVSRQRSASGVCSAAADRPRAADRACRD